MPGKMKIVVGLVVIWALIFAASFFASAGIEGPRNLDTGFKRLDVLFRFQAFAFAIAIASALAGIIWRRAAKRILLIGLTPLIVTGLLIVALVLGSKVIASRTVSEEAASPSRPATTAVDTAVPPQN